MSDPIPTSVPRSSTRTSALVGAGILLSRLLGLVRQMLMAKYLGAGVVSDAFNGALRITNILQNLFGEGALSASFIPVYARALEHGKDDEADRIAGAIAAILALLVAVIVLLGVLATPLVVRLVVSGYEGETLDLAIRLSRILFPGAGILVMSAWCLGILNSHRKFFLSYVAPVFWNVAMIGALLAYGPRVGEVSLVIALAWASVLGAALQMGVQLPAVLKLLKHPRYRPDIAFPPVREALRNFFPAFMTRGVVQLSGYIDISLASNIDAKGIVTLMSNAQAIYMLPISLFGMAVSAAELPEMSRDRGTDTDAMERLRNRLNAALPRVAFFVVPSAIAFFVLGEAISGVLLQHGRFGATESLRTWAILAGSAIGLLASALGRLYSSTFFALRDTKTPLRFAIVRVVLTASLGYVFAFPLPRALGLAPWTGAVGLALSSGIAGWVEFVLLRRGVTARIGETGIAGALLLKLFGSGLAAGATGYGAMWLLRGGHHSVRGAAALAVFTIIYGMGTLALGVPEAKGIAGRVLRR